MIAMIFAVTIFVIIIWYVGMRALAFYGAYLGGVFTHQLGAHWLTIAIAAFIGFGAVYVVIMILSALAAKRPWLGIVLIGLICAPAFLIGYSGVSDYMRSPGQGAGDFEANAVGVIAGLVMAVSSFAAYQRDIAKHSGD